MPIDINFQALVRQSLVNEALSVTEWQDWRYCYEGGEQFRDLYLEKFSDRETAEEFKRRKALTPIPAFAKREINRVRNSIAGRFPDITRRGGSPVWQEAVAGQNRGVDRRGSGMNNFVATRLLSELLVMGKVGVLVDAPKVTGPTKADVPANFRPYLNVYERERFPIILPADVDSPSDWSAVMLKDCYYEVDPKIGGKTEVTRYRYYYLDPSRGNLVTVQELDGDGKEKSAPILTNLTEIPFVVFDIRESLIRDVCSHQIALLNMISSDSNYAIDSNFPFMVRQRGNTANYLIGEEDEANVGAKKGLYYDKNMEAPKFISPPTDPMKASLDLRKELKAEIRELVSGVIADLGAEGNVDSGLAFIGQCLNSSENRIWDHWTAYESTDPANRKECVVAYPEYWSLKTDQERIEEATSLLDLMNRLPGQQGKKEAAKRAYDKLYRGVLSPELIDNIKAEVDDAPYTTSDPDIIFGAVENGVCGPETATLALGFNREEAAAAQKAQAKRAEMIVAAQADAAGGAARGAKDLSKNPNSNKLARKGEADPTAKLGGAQDKGVRGKGN